MIRHLSEVPGGYLLIQLSTLTEHFSKVLGREHSSQ